MPITCFVDGGVGDPFSKYLGVSDGNTTTKLLTLDGLRGLLAVFVFFYHSVIWFKYLKSGVWESPDSNFFTHLGQSSVEFFFMITAFLFFGKLFGSSKINWLDLYRGRLYRLTPAYWLAVTLIVFVVILVGDFSISVLVSNYASQILKWILFTLPGSPSMGGIADTSLIVAAVTWSLRYEWLFYMSLPFFGLLLGTRVSAVWASLGFIGFIGLLWVALKDNAWHLLYFGAGAFVAYARRNFPSIGMNFRHSNMASFVCLVFLVPLLIFVHGAHNIVSFIVLFFIFWCVSGGNSFWGVLRMRGVRVLGEMSYSIYLLHGFVLFVVFYIVLGMRVSAGLSVIEYWFVISGCAILVLMISILSCRWFEMPFIGRKIHA